jgi:hypothetical protein
VGIFDLVLIASVLLSLVTVLAAAGCCLAGRFRLAARLLGAWLAYAAIYLIVVMAASLLTKPRQLAIGEHTCFDDWCIAVERIESERLGVGATYRIAFQISSRAKRRPQRERNLAVYLQDTNGLRYDARDPAGEPAFNVMLPPGETVHTTREFDVPVPDAQPHLVITHEGGFPIGWFIIGQGPFFQGIQLALPSPSPRGSK